MNTDTKKNKYAWLPDMMPGVAQKIADKKKQYGDAHVNLCWQRGVKEGQPGWFFAREGSITVGTPDAKDVDVFQLMMMPTGMVECALYMRTPEGKIDGT